MVFNAVQPVNIESASVTSRAGRETDFREVHDGSSIVSRAVQPLKARSPTCSKAGVAIR